MHDYELPEHSIVTMPASCQQLHGDLELLAAGAGEACMQNPRACMHAFMDEVMTPKDASQACKRFAAHL